MLFNPDHWYFIYAGLIYQNGVLHHQLIFTFFEYGVFFSDFNTAMKSYPRQNYIYTSGFCEENIWWLIKSLSTDGLDVNRMNVLLFSNTDKSILVTNQLAAEPGIPILWDYHVVLQFEIGAGRWVLDFDTRLAFPEKLVIYCEKTFPRQAVIAEQYRTWVRTIPAQFYLKYFCSDRNHMHGRIGDDSFPDYPVIQPAESERRILLSEFWNMQKTIEGCKVEPITAYSRMAY